MVTDDEINDKSKKMRHKRKRANKTGHIEAARNAKCEKIRLFPLLL